MAPYAGNPFLDPQQTVFTDMTCSVRVTEDPMHNGSGTQARGMMSSERYDEAQP